MKISFRENIQECVNIRTKWYAEICRFYDITAKFDFSFVWYRPPPRFCLFTLKKESACGEGRSRGGNISGGRISSRLCEEPDSSYSHH